MARGFSFAAHGSRSRSLNSPQRTKTRYTSVNLTCTAHCSSSIASHLAPHIISLCLPCLARSDVRYERQLDCTSSHGADMIEEALKREPSSESLWDVR